MGNERRQGEEDRAALALGGETGQSGRGYDRRVVQVVKTICEVFAGEPISLPVREVDGALTGWRTCPAPYDGFLVEEGDVSIFLGEDVVNVAVRAMGKLRQARKKRG